MIYSGVANGNPSNTNKRGSKTQIETTAYNQYNDNTYVGYMYGIGGETSYALAHQNISDSHAKAIIDRWYQINIANTGYGNYVDTNTGFCNDRQINKTAASDLPGDGYGTQNSAYASLGRLRDTSGWKSVQTPILRCTNKSRDLFTVSSASTGNKKLTYPVGLITNDEAVFAGGFVIKENETFYLYTANTYWTMSPYHFFGIEAYMFCVYSNGYIGNGGGMSNELV